jgi:hypothetical protein
MALKIYRKDSTPAMLTFTLPGLRVENDSRDPGQPFSVLTLDVLTNWLHDSARLDVSQPQVQAEARQLMELFEPYYEAAPPAWQQLNTKAVAGLRNFDFGGLTAPLAEYGAFGALGFALIAVPGVCLCIFYALALPMFKRTFAEARAEIEAGRWTPPALAPKRFPAAIKVLLAISLIPVALAVEAAFHGERTAMFMILLSLGILMIVVLQLHSRRQIQLARERGLWPQLGELPTLDHVKRLVQAGEKIMAIKLYRQIHSASFADAKTAVEKLAGLAMPPQPAQASPIAGVPATPVSIPRFSRLALVGAGWAPWLFLAALVVIPVGLSRGEPGSAPNRQGWWLVALIITLVPLGLTAPFGTTILGCMALSRIRRSGGRLCGLGLALFDAIFFPLLALDSLIAWVIYTMVNSIELWLSLKGIVPPPDGWIWPLLLLVLLALDAVLAWWAWRVVNKPLKDVESPPLAPKSVAP